MARIDRLLHLVLIAGLFAAAGCESDHDDGGPSPAAGADGREPLPAGTLEWVSPPPAAMRPGASATIQVRGQTSSANLVWSVHPPTVDRVAATLSSPASGRDRVVVTAIAAGTAIVSVTDMGASGGKASLNRGVTVYTNTVGRVASPEWGSGAATATNGVKAANGPSAK